MSQLDSNKIINVESVTKQLKLYQSSILTHGMFDLLHPGHIAMLCAAKKLADVLVVGIDSDELTRSIKGSGRPIRNFEERAYMVANLECVDYVFKIDPEDYHCDLMIYFTNLYKVLAPTMVATTIAAGEHGILKQKQCENAGVKFIDLSHLYNSDKSTTLLIKKILGQYQ